VDPRAGLDTEARGKIILPLPGIELRSPGRPVCSQILTASKQVTLHQVTIMTEGVWSIESLQFVHILLYNLHT
jgi:hypothetical protein